MNRVLKHYFVPHEGNGYRPHFFSRKSVGLVALFASAIFLLSLGYSAILSRVDYLASVLPSVLIDLANQDRDIYKLPHLKRNTILEAVAREKANDMAKYSYFAHVSPTGITPWYWFTKAGYKFTYAGENLAINFSDSSVVNQAWMNSPGHRANILSQNFSEVGIATAEGIYEGRPTTFVVQEFGKPAEPEPVQFTVAKKTVAPNIVPITQTDTFIAVKDTNAKPKVGSKTLGATQYSSIASKIATSPTLTLRVTYLVMALIIILAILLSLFVELKRHHARHLIQGVFLLAFIFTLAYLYGHVAISSVSII